ncbi:Uma2 family endonuclease [Spirulina sp. CS-785/01]|uniref:Uma2 family endonuclease n=1 Tax=Spirulina sp. CS-785/01 TaxID=3021716 RepID=UPI00232BEE9A|nr:Uma2 family endonuclease [Spirulina sp. CS-785/01]MDB9314057.1 Uma2 family endonuclease [Spirulina sp. CS-785/01]
MITAEIAPPQNVNTPPSPIETSLQDWLDCPLEGTEWVEGNIIEKNGMTGKHGRIQAKLARYWGNYMESSHQGGEVYTETPCQTQQRGRRPDVAYLTPELVEQFGEFTTLPQSFSLIAEVISPTDAAEAVFAKVREYLQSGCEEVWLIFPESQWVGVMTGEQQVFFSPGEEARTQKGLQGFTIAVDTLLA